MRGQLLDGPCVLLQSRDGPAEGVQIADSVALAQPSSGTDDSGAMRDGYFFRSGPGLARCFDLTTGRSPIG